MQSRRKTAPFCSRKEFLDKKSVAGNRADPVCRYADAVCAALSLAPHPRQSPLRFYQPCGTGFRHRGTGAVFQKGKLTGFNSHFQSVFVPQTADFSQKFPNIQISLVEESSANLSLLLQAGKLDLMIDNCILDEQIFDHYVYQKEHLLLAVPKSCSVNTRLQEYQIPIETIHDGSFLSPEVLSVPLNSFANEPFIILRSDNDTGKRALTICQENNFTPHTIFRLDQQMTAYNIACSGMGITFIGDLLLASAPATSELIFYKLPGKNCNRNVSFYWKKGRYISRAMEEFLKIALPQ